MFFHNIGISRLIALMALFPATLVYAWGGESTNLTTPSSVQQTHNISAQGGTDKVSSAWDSVI